MTRAAWGLLAATILVWLATLLPWFVQWCVHVDGLLYSTVARNLASGPMGQPFCLHFTSTMHPQFYEHPPVSFWMFAGWLRWVDGSEAAEATYGAAVAVGVFCGLWTAAKAQWPEPDAPLWLAPLLLISNPMSSWLLGNHMLEGPLLLVLSWQMVAALRAIEARHASAAALWSAAAAAGSVVALGIRGPTAGIALAVPWMLAAASAPPRRRAAWACAAGSTAAAAAMVALCCASAEAREYFARYGQQQVAASLLGMRETTNGRLAVVRFLLTEWSVPVAVAGAIWGLGRQRSCERVDAPKEMPTPLMFSRIVPWLWLCVLASVPLLLSPKQHRWYLAPSLPYLSMALMSVTAASGRTLADAFERRPRWRLSGLVGLAGGVALTLGLTLKSAHDGAWRNRSAFETYVWQQPEAKRAVLDCSTWPTADRWWCRAFAARYLHQDIDAAATCPANESG